MQNNKFEMSVGSQESLTKEQLQEKLDSAKSAVEQLLFKAKDSEFYDNEMYDSFVSSARQFGGNTEMHALYVGSCGDDYRAMLDNYQKAEDFKKNQLEPAEQEVRRLQAEINKINNQESENQRFLMHQETENKFRSEKSELISTLYGLLDGIHSQIPKEAHDVGMKMDVAIKTYKPELIHHAQLLEYLINKAEEVCVTYQLQRLKEEIASYDYLDI